MGDKDTCKICGNDSIELARSLESYERIVYDVMKKKSVQWNIDASNRESAENKRRLRLARVIQHHFYPTLLCRHCNMSLTRYLINKFPKDEYELEILSTEFIAYRISRLTKSGRGAVNHNGDFVYRAKKQQESSNNMPELVDKLHKCGLKKSYLLQSTNDELMALTDSFETQ